jgi:hypothetical protein
LVVVAGQQQPTRLTAVVQEAKFDAIEAPAAQVTLITADIAGSRNSGTSPPGGDT